MRGLVCASLFCAWFALVPAAGAIPARAQSQPLSQLVFTLDGRYNSMHSWEADFVQTYTNGLQSRTESGRLYLQKPGRMRWDYLQPVHKQFIVNGDSIWQYTAGQPEASLTRIKDARDLRTPLRFLLGHTDLPKELSGLSYSGLKPWHPGDYVIYGRPNPDEAGSWREVWIEITPAYEIDRLIIVGVDGSRNDIRLSHIKPNVELPGKLFHFTPPPGVRVVPGA